MHSMISTHCSVEDWNFGGYLEWLDSVFAKQLPCKSQPNLSAALLGWIYLEFLCGLGGLVGYFIPLAERALLRFVSRSLKFPSKRIVCIQE